MSTLIANQHPTMSSREIAELVESRHDDVKRSISRLAERGVIELPPMADVKNHLGQTVQEYRVGKRDSYVVVAQLSPEFTARLVDRWQELEAGAARPAALPDFTKPAIAARAWASQFEAREAAEAKVAELAPKADFHDAVADAVNCQDMLAVAKVLGTGRTRLFGLLRSRGVLMPGNLPYQRFIDAGYFRVIERTWRDSGDKSHTTYKTLVTGKGLTYIQRLLSSAVTEAA